MLDLEMMPPSMEEILLQKAQAGNREAIADIFNRYDYRLLSYLMLFTPDRNMAEDWLQEVFRSLIKTLAEKRRIENLKTYLFRSARNKALDELRRKKTKSLQEYDVAGISLVGHPKDAGHDAELLRSVFDALHTEEQELLRLKIHEDMSFREISELMDTPESTLKNRYYQSMEKLRTRLGEPS